jgi:bacillithiol biosynthesis cysteine-adding enzyme BshC
VGRAFSNSYLAGEPAAHAFFAPGFRDPGERGRRARLAAERAVPPALLHTLRDQQALLPASAARQTNLDALAAGRTAVVATGQQVGLFLGPLYAFYKAASAIAVARAIEAEAGIRCVPLFWLQTEDHDFEEIRSCTVADGDGQPARLALPDEHQGTGRCSVAYRVLPDDVTTLLDRLAEALGATPASEETLALLRAHYRPGRSLPAAFASTLAALFADEGLLVFDPRDTRVAALAAPLYRTCIEEAEAIERTLRTRQAALAASFAEQVPIRERGALVFFHRDSASGPRFRLERQPGASARETPWRLAGASASVGHAELLEILARDPLRFSTSALLRPIVQDALLPTVAYVAGPGEINYFAQLPPLYQHFAVTPPLLVPRARFLCVDARARRRLGALGLKAADLSMPVAELVPRIASARPAGAPAPAALRTLVGSRIGPALEEIASGVLAAGQRMRRPAERTRAGVARGLERLIAHYARVLVEQDEVTAGRLRGLELALFPRRTPQERFYGWPHLAGRHGAAGLKRLVLDRLQGAGPFVTEVQELEP